MTQRLCATLPDGRTLSYLDAGDPIGIPCLFTIGSPSSALGGIAFADAAERAGVRLISVDKPGYGESTRVPRRTLLGYGQDLSDLADELGLREVALVGQSGGGPHAMAAAHVMGQRISNLCLLSTFGSVTEPWAAAKGNPFIGLVMWLARRAPPLVRLPMAAIRLAGGNPDRAEKLARPKAPQMSPRQREAVLSANARHIYEGLADAFKPGLGPAADEFYALGQPWGFEPRAIATVTDLWHGTQDKSCTITIARGLAERMPNATLHELEDVGHGFFGPELDRAMETLRGRHNAFVRSRAAPQEEPA